MVLDLEGDHLKQQITSFNFRNVINLFIVHKLDRYPREFKTDFTLGDCF